MNPSMQCGLMRKTRIIGTIGPASDDIDMLRQLVASGLDVARLNYSHGTHEQKTELVARLRTVEAENGRPLGILADLPGPKLRLGTFEGSIQLVEGEEMILACGEEDGVASEPVVRLPVSYPGLSEELREGDPVLLSDGLIRLEVLEAPQQPAAEVRCRVVDGGPISARKGINVPQTVVGLPAVGEKDERATAHALSEGVDFIAVSYVRTAADIQPVKDAIAAAGVHTWVIAKIEHPAALEHLEEILDVVDVVMVARGDLGVEIPLERVPMAQERIVQAGMARGIPVIIATQMLESMVENPRPTRAEVTDVATAIRQGASCVMLSGETASGRYPVEAVQTMARVATSVEEEVSGLIRAPLLSDFRATRSMANAAIELAKGVEADRIIVASESAIAARLVAAYRPEFPVTVMTNRPRAVRKTTMLHGVDTVLIEEQPRARDTLESVIKELYADGRAGEGDTIVSMTGSPLAISGATSAIRLIKVGEGGVLADFL